MPDQPHHEPGAIGVELSNIDIIKLHAAVTMSICGALHEKGLVSNQEMAAILRGQVRADDADPWAHIVLAIAGALTFRSKAEAPAPSPPPQSNRLALIVGGRHQTKGADDS